MIFKLMETKKEKLNALIDCKDVGEMNVSKLDEIKQPIQRRKFVDEFVLDSHRKEPRTPSEP